MKIALVRGKFLNAYEMQMFTPLVNKFSFTAFGSFVPFHDQFPFPVNKLPSPMDVPDFPFKMPVLNRLCIDAHYLFGLEEKLKGFDIAHSAETYYHYTQQCLNAKRRGYVKKVIASVQENIPFNNEGIWGRKGFKRRAREELDLMIAISKQTRDTLITEGADPDKIVVINRYVDTNVFKPTEKEARRKKREERKELRILFCGRLEKQKGVYDVLYAANTLLKDRSLREYHLSFEFVGSGSEEEELKHREQELGIAGNVVHKQVSYDQIVTEYNLADILVAPSRSTPTWQEQYGSMVLLEAQACGLPIVSTRSGGIPENVGDAALLVAEGDGDALAGAIKRLIVHPALREQYSKKARSRALRYHDVSIGAKKLADMYRSLMD